MGDAFPVRAALRRATADWHRRVDRAFSAFDLGDRTGYGQFLMAQASAHLSVEAALEAAGAATLLPDWPDRRRAPLLRDDLAALGLAPPAGVEAPVFAGAPAVLGAVYVLEGSRLGGALLKRSVPSEFPTSFLGAGGSAAWRRLLHMLERELRTAAEIEVATNSARRVFSLFEQGGRRFLRTG